MIDNILRATNLLDVLVLDLSSSCNAELNPLERACIDFLRARGYECLRRHDGVPMEEGEYVLIHQSKARTHIWGDNLTETTKTIRIFKANGSFLFALGPLRNYEEK